MLGREAGDDYGHPKWRCICDCGNYVVRTAAIKSSKVASCGCSKGLPRPSRVRDLSGQRFGRLVASSVQGCDKKKAQWLCRCDCGADLIVAMDNLVGGHTRSCGCLKKELASARFSQMWDGAKLRGLARHVSDDARRAVHKAWLQRTAYEAKRSKKRRDELRDGYVRRLLSQVLGVKPRDLPLGLIEVKREHLRLVRLIRDFKQAIEERTEHEE